MSKKSIFARMFESFAKDAEPEEVLEAAGAVRDAECGKAKDEEPEPTKAIETRDEDMEMVMQAIHELNEKLEAMKNDLSTHYKDDKEEGEELNKKLSGLDAVEEAIKAHMSQDSDDGEEEVEVDPEIINEDEEPEEVEEKEEAEVIESDDEEPEEVEEKVEEKVSAADSAMSMAMLRAIKPFVAEMPPAQRKRATDALNRAVRKSMRVKPSQPLPGGYGALTKRKTTDAQAAESRRAFGEACRKRNPHCKQ